jgi:asparagine synthase (glutamine-hydrolysing)
LSDAGIQPMTSADGRYVIVFNGEIYNYEELRRLVLGRGYELRSTSDTEVLPCLYDIEGMSMFRRLRGMYAFALWDTREHELLLARDPLGIKPLYYADDGKQLWFASQVRALLAAGIDARPDAAGQVGFHLWGNVPEPFTLYRNIQALPAGQFLRLRQHKAPEIREFWSLGGVLEKFGFVREICGWNWGQVWR